MQVLALLFSGLRVRKYDPCCVAHGIEGAPKAIATPRLATVVDQQGGYSHIDEKFRDQLEVQLAMLKRQGLVELWHDCRRNRGDYLDWTINKELDEADIIFLLVSPKFLASDSAIRLKRDARFSGTG